jgi:hypothetical protein
MTKNKTISNRVIILDSCQICELYNSHWYGGQYQDIQTAHRSWYRLMEMILSGDVGQFVGFMIPWKITVHLHCGCQFLVFNAISTIVTYMLGNIRIYKLPLGPSTDLETDISLAFGSDNIISISLYHDLWAVCISWYCPPYQWLLYN